MAAANDAKKHCIRCLLEEIDPEAYERDIRRILIHMEPHEKASDAVYHWRLSVCRDCDYLSKGTCNACGCFVELRAALERCLPLQKMGGKRRQQKRNRAEGKEETR